MVETADMPWGRSCTTIWPSPRSRGGNREWRCHDGRENVRIVGFGLLVSVGIPRYGLKDSIGRYTMQTFVIEEGPKRRFACHSECGYMEERRSEVRHEVGGYLLVC